MMLDASLIAKPAYGSPCNGCGQCCRDQVCPLGARVFGTSDGPCKAIKHTEDGRVTCGLVMAPRKFVPVLTAIHGAQTMALGAAVLIGAGHGCDAQLVGEHADEAQRLRMRAACAGVRVMPQITPHLVTYEVRR